MSSQPAKKWFTVTDYYRMADTGILTAEDRVELIEGEIIKMSPIGSRHAACVNRLTAYLHAIVQNTAIVSVQNPIHLDEYSEPEPDLALLKPRKDFYANAHPTPSDILLIIEVSDTSFEYDRDVKLPLYAKVGIPEAWLIDLQNEKIEIHRQPVANRYKISTTLKRGASFQSPAIAGASISVDEILG